MDSMDIFTPHASSKRGGARVRFSAPAGHWHYDEQTFVTEGSALRAWAQEQLRHVNAVRTFANFV